MIVAPLLVLLIVVLLHMLGGHVAYRALRFVANYLIQKPEKSHKFHEDLNIYWDPEVDKFIATVKGHHELVGMGKTELLAYEDLKAESAVSNSKVRA